MALNPTSLAVPLINGVQYDFTSLEVKVRGKPIIGRAFTAVNYSETKEPGKVWAGLPVAHGRTRGQYGVTAGLSMPKAFLHDFLKELVGEAMAQGMAAGAIAGLASAGNVTVGYMESSFLLTASYADVGCPLTTDTLVGCQIAGIEESHAPGADGLTVSLNLDVAYMLRNGLPPMGSAMIR